MSTPTRFSTSSKRNNPLSTPTSNQNHRPSFSTPQGNPSSNAPESRSQRLFTQEDEIRLLKSLFEITKSTSSTVPPITVDSPIFNCFKKSFGPKFSHSQITDKLRRSRLKYHKQARTKSLIKSPHDRQVYEIALKIWGKKFTQKKNLKGARNTERKENSETLADVWGVRKEEVELENFPGNVVWKEGLRCLKEYELRNLNAKWKILRIEEAKLMAKWAELVQEQIKVIVEAIGFSSS